MGTFKRGEAGVCKEAGHVRGMCRVCICLKGPRPVYTRADKVNGDSRFRKLNRQHFFSVLSMVCHIFDCQSTHFYLVSVL